MKPPLNPQYAAGFLLHKLGCITIQAQTIGEDRTRRARIPIGVAHGWSQAAMPPRTHA